jgi:hypothetical protein
MKLQKPVVIAAHLPAPTRPRLEIIPDARQYEQLCRDLKLLRRLGATSNTDAIIDAVRQHADRMDKVSGKKKNRPGGDPPPPGRATGGESCAA